jgi:hypothetical protein
MGRYGHRSTLVAVGAGELALAATIHLVENLLVIGPLRRHHPGHGMPDVENARSDWLA